MKRRFILSCTVLAVMATHVASAEPSSKLEPLMAIPDKVVLHDDFSKRKPLKKGVWQSRQGTRWVIEGGVLKGQQSSPEYQAKKKDHFGYEARISIPVTPQEFVASFSFRFIEGSETSIVPFIEFGHHVCRVRFSKRGASLLSDHEVMKLAEDKGFIWQSGKWYHALAEMKDGEFVFQIEDGPTLYAQRDSFKIDVQNTGKAFGIAGPRKGKVELDNLSIWTVKEDRQAGWGKLKATFPAFEPIQIKKPKVKTKAKKTISKKKVRQRPPTQAFDAPGAPSFTRLDGKPGVNPPADVDGDFLIGPNYIPAPELKVVEGVPQGEVLQFSIDSKDGTLYNPGIARDVFGELDPNNPKTLTVETHEIDYKRTITVYIPAQYQSGSAAPFIISHDGPKVVGKPDMRLPRILDNLIAQKRVPPMIAIMIANGGGDAQGHERGREYDNMSGMFAEYIETHILPQVEKKYKVKLSKDPNARAVMGSSSGGSAALIMAWFRPDLYSRVLTTSGTFVNQAWPFDPKYPDGAWGFHKTLIPNSEVKPLRIFLAVGDRDLLNPNIMRDDMHDWVKANNRMARVLKAKGYHYQYLYCLDARHGIGNAKAQILPHALEWLWKDYKISPSNTIFTVISPE